eukprot:365219-Chlamydomonas_euryale.AAC.9
MTTPDITPGRTRAPCERPSRPARTCTRVGAFAWQHLCALRCHLGSHMCDLAATTAPSSTLQDADAAWYSFASAASIARSSKL